MQNAIIKYLTLVVVMLTVHSAAIPIPSNLESRTNQLNQTPDPDKAPFSFTQAPIGKRTGLDSFMWFSKTDFSGTARYRGMSCVEKTADSCFFYGLGGQQTLFADCFRYNILTNTWDTIASMPGVNANQTAVYWIDDRDGTDSSGIFVLGRYSPTYAKTCYRWWKSTNTWDTITHYPSPVARPGNMAGIIGDTIYLIARKTVSTSGFYKYHIRSGTWSVGETPPDSMNSFGAICSFGGRVWQLGGWPDRKTFQVYRPGLGWTLLPTPQDNVGGNSGHLAGYGNNIFTWGGGAEWIPYNRLAYYDTTTNIWILEETPLTRPLLAAFYGIVDSVGILGIHHACGYTNSGQIKYHERCVDIHPWTRDVGISEITGPVGGVQTGDTIRPKGLVKNFGTATQTNIPVSCWIDLYGIRVYEENTVIPNLVAGDTATATFPIWNVGSGPQYQMTMFTALPGDSSLLNDTARAIIYVTTWENITSPIYTPDRLAHGAVYDSVGDKIYMFGGTPNGQSGSNVNLSLEYDPMNDTWINRPPMPTAKRWINASYAGNKIYLIGGYDNNDQILNQNLCFDIASNTWAIKSPSPRTRCAHLEVVWRDSLIYVMGGTNGATTLSDVDIYNPLNDSWMVGTSLPEPAEMGDAVIIGDTIYIIGAIGPVQSTFLTNMLKGAINSEDPTQITWITGPTLPPFYSNVSATALGDKIYWLGWLGLATVTNIWFYVQGFDTIFEFTPYPIVVTNTQLVARNTWTSQELYVLAGDSGIDWAPPNRKYMKYTFYQTPVITNEKLTTNEFKFSIAPNPAVNNAKIKYKLPVSGTVSYKIYNVLGVLVKSCNYPTPTKTGSLTIDLKALSAGVYILRFESGMTKETRKLVLER